MLHEHARVFLVAPSRDVQRILAAHVADVDLTELEQAQWAWPSMLPVPAFSQQAL